MTEINVALKSKEAEARREADEAMKKADQKIIEIKSTFHEETRKERRALSEKNNKSCAEFKKREQQLVTELQSLVPKLIFDTANAATRKLCEDRFQEIKQEMEEREIMTKDKMETKYLSCSRKEIDDRTKP